MKTTKHYITMLAVLLFATGLTTSCIKEDYANAGDTATVNLYFNTRNGDAAADEPTEGTLPVGTNEGIKTLRVIITDVTNGQEIVERNIYRNNLGDVVSKTLTIMDVPVGVKNFYVIANEASVGLGEEDFPSEEEVLQSSDDILRMTVEAKDQSGNYYFPRLRRDIGDYGLPITGKVMGVELVKGENDNLIIPITHAVAKVVMNFVNNTTGNIPIETFKLEAFNSSKAFLFGEANVTAPVVPSGTTYTDFTFTREGSGATILPGSYETVENNRELIVFYVYETDADPAEYKVSMTTPSSGVNVGEPAQFLTTKQIIRNHAVVVRATVNPSGKDVTLELGWVVKDWDTTDANIEVPPFN